jgi:AcrR family transcriptional regulator
MREDQNKRKQEILTTAARLFRQKGYNATSMNDLAKECGLFKGSLYHYFKNKEEILQDVIKPYFEYLLPHLEAIDNSKMMPTEKLRMSLEIQMRAIEANRDAVSVALREDRALGNPYREIYIAQRNGLEDHLVAILKEGIEKGVFRKVDIRMMSKAILGMCNWATVWYSRSGRLSSKAVADHFTDLAISGLKTKRLSQPDEPLTFQDTKNSTHRDLPSSSIDKLQGQLPGQELR